MSPAFRAKTNPHTEQRSRKDQPENRCPSPQCGQRLRRPRPSAVTLSFHVEGVIPNAYRCRVRVICIVDRSRPPGSSTPEECLSRRQKSPISATRSRLAAHSPKRDYERDQRRSPCSGRGQISATATRHKVASATTCLGVVAVSQTQVGDRCDSETENCGGRVVCSRVATIRLSCSR